MRSYLRDRLIESLIALGLIWALELVLFPEPKPQQIIVIEVSPVDVQDVNE